MTETTNNSNQFHSNVEITSTDINNQELLKIEDLHTYFFTEEGVVKAVNGVSFSIHKNEIMGLVGETGCGKSVTALSILRLIRPPGEVVSGKISFLGEDLTKKSEIQIRKYRGNQISMIFQDPMNSLNPVLKVGDQLAEVFLLHQQEYLREKLPDRINENNLLKEQLNKLKLQKKMLNDPQQKPQLDIQIKKLKKKVKKKIMIKDVAWNEAKRILDLVGIPDSEIFLDRYPHELSGGMRQRIMISMALACTADLLIADEPTTALDVTIQAQILEEMRRLKQRIKNSILMITHSLGVIYELCDRVAVMYAGKIVEYGTVKKIFDHPSHPYTEGLLASIPRVTKIDRNKKLNIIPGSVPNLIDMPPQCNFAPRCRHTMKICTMETPSLDVLDNGVHAACFLYSKRKTQSPELFVKIEKDIQEELI
jgi:oligopeptide/dipeptide ABC transporter ATP-binding protein